MRMKGDYTDPKNQVLTESLLNRRATEVASASRLLYACRSLSRAGDPLRRDSICDGTDRIRSEAMMFGRTRPEQAGGSERSERGKQ
eukprot:scaffold7212_cov165-Cylindrotheca_fusiformis.AAC.9